jgi:hypothetical protein
VATVPRR